FKLVYGNQEYTPINLRELSNAELVKLLTHENQFYVRHARRLLQERGPNPEVHAALRKLLQEARSEPGQLQALWALHVTGGLRESDALQLLHHPGEYVRAW